MEIERAAPIAAPPSLQLEPCVRGQCLNTVATTTASTRAVTAGAAKRVFIAIEVVFISLTSALVLRDAHSKRV